MLRQITRAGFLLLVVAAAGFAQAPVEPKPAVMVINKGYRLLINRDSGSIVSFRSALGAGRDLLIPGHERLPLIKIELMDDHLAFKTVSSAEAKEVTTKVTPDADGQTITINFREIGQLPIEARVTIRCPMHEPMTYWNLELNNRTTRWIGHIQFPIIEVPFDIPNRQQSSHILWSIGDGALAGPVAPGMSGGLWAPVGDDTPEVWRSNNYPGEWVRTQLMAYYNDAGGLYVACDDPKGLPKYLGPLMERDGVTMGVGHYPGTRGPSEYKLPYNVVLGTFHGDWYTAAEIYRDWASQQPFCATKLADRTDVPKWLGQSPFGIAFPLRGQGDWDPHGENPEYVPLTNALPYLDKIAAALDAPLLPIVFNWEHAGPWVQPDAYPPVGGEAAFREFMAKAKAKGWAPAIYGDGLCWVTWQKNTNYDGMPYFQAHGGDEASVVNWDGKLLQFSWPWRTNYLACVGTEKGRQMVLDMTRHMAELGPAVVQQFDQTPGPFACYSTRHGHPPVPGPWMTEAFTSLLREDEAAARSVNPAAAMSCEAAPPETYLQDFQTWDARVLTCPLYAFLYHEYETGFEGFYTNRISDEAQRASVARALVTGYMMDFTLRDKGLIHYDWDQPWTRAAPDQAAALDWAKRTNRFRAQEARDFLIYGRMLRPWVVSGVSERDFGAGKEPAVASATWQAQDGRIGVVLANYANLQETPRIELEGQGSKTLALYVDGQKQEKGEVQLPSVIDIPMQPRSLCLVEVN